jgi:MFS family permease
LFGHFGDRIDRKATLVALVTMGISTVAIGALPSCRTIGVAATLLLALCRFGRVWGPGDGWDGYYLAGAAALTFTGLLAARNAKDDEL